MKTNTNFQTADMLFNDMQAANITVVTTEVFQNDEKPTRQLERIQVCVSTVPTRSFWNAMFSVMSVCQSVQGGDFPSKIWPHPPPT